MKIRYYGHASCQFVGNNGQKLLADPYAFDPIYGNMTWQFPSCPISRQEFIQQDAIYISHEHPDHLSPNTLAMFDRNTPIVIRDYKGTMNIRQVLEGLGFHKIIELDHHQSCEPVPGLKVTLFADPNSSDSLIVASDGVHTALDQNDCILSDQEFAWIGKNYKIDVGLLFFSGGSLYPACFDMTDEEKQRETKKRIQQQFESSAHTASLLQLSKVIPVANDLCVLRDPTMDPYLGALPVEYRDYVQSMGNPFSTYLMVPGETFTFSEASNDYHHYFKNRSEWAQSLAKLRSEKRVQDLVQNINVYEKSFRFDHSRFERLFQAYCNHSTHHRVTLSTPDETIHVAIRFYNERESFDYCVHYGADTKSIERLTPNHPFPIHMELSLGSHLAAMCLEGVLTWEDLLNSRWRVSRKNAAYSHTEYSFWEFLSNFTVFLETSNEQPQLHKRGQFQQCILPA